jgi:uroporphyrinogen decarboxylase
MEKKSMTKEERVLRTIAGKAIDFLPSQVTFSDRNRLGEISSIMGFSSVKEFEDYLQNHIQYSFITSDMPLFNRNDEKLMRECEKMGFAKVDWGNGLVYDEWGVGIQMYSDGIFFKFNPLKADIEGKKKIAEKYMPDSFNIKTLYQSVEDATKNYAAPDPNQNGNFHYIIKDLKKYSGDFLVLPAGFVGIYERAYDLMGFEEFMVNLAINPNLIEELLDKITDYKVEVAKKFVALGFKAGHTCDDLGTQNGVLFSLKTFRKVLRPRMERLWQVYKDAGLPIFFHSCGNITEFIPDLIEIGLDVLEPVQPCMDLRYLKKEFGKDITFWGGIDTQKILPDGTPEQVKKMVRETIRILGKGGGYIIAPSQEIMKDIPINNIKALIETIVEEREKVLN